MQAVPTFNVLNGDEIEGPYSPGQLRVLEDRGSINGQSLIARHGEAEWLPLEVWREVIQGAPTHRGAIPGSVAKKRKPGGSDESAGGLAKAALLLALLGVALIAGGISTDQQALWIGGASTFGFALVLWLGAARSD